MDFAIAKVSSKGQIVIPSSLRKDIIKGDQFLVIRDGGRLILKNMAGLASDIKEDIAFADRIEKAWLEYDSGKFVTKSKGDFLAELKKC